MQLDQELEPLESSGRKRLAVAVMRDTFKHHFKGKFEKVVQLKDVMNLYMTTEGTTAADMAQFGTCGVLFQAGGSRVPPGGGARLLPVPHGAAHALTPSLALFWAGARTWDHIRG